MSLIIDFSEVVRFLLANFMLIFGTHLRTVTTYITIEHYGHEYIMNEPEFIDINLNHIITY